MKVWSNLVIFVLAVVFSSCYGESSKQWFYSIVIDAGSKGSRLVIFKWQPDTELSRKKIQVPITVGMKAVNPGLAASALDPGTVKDPLKELLDFAIETLKPLEAVYQYIPLYLKATAGLRDLIPTARDAVMKETVGFISGYAPFDFNASHALVISGEEEGAYAWLAVNALRGTLGRDQGDSTFGVIDLGGASVQISFVPDTNHYVLQNCYPMTLTDFSTYRLYSKSYLHYGIVEANRRLASNIITENILKVDSVGVIENPCYYKGMEFSPDFATSEYKFPITVDMVGSGNFPHCLSELGALFSKTAVQCWVRDCTFDGVYQPRLDSRPFMGIGNIGKILQLVGIATKSTLKEIHAKGSQMCAMSFEQIDTQFNELSTKVKKNLCFSIAYIYVLLTVGLGFTISDLADPSALNSQIEFNNFVGSEKVDWALGAIIWEANQQPPSTISEYLQRTKSIDTTTVAVTDSQAVPSKSKTNRKHDIEGWGEKPDTKIRAQLPEHKLTTNYV